MSDEIEHDKPDAITALRAEVERLKADITYADKHAAKVEDLLWGTAKENEKLKALTVKADEAIARQQQDLEEAANRAADCDTLRAEVERLKYVEADYDLHERELIDLEEDNGRLTSEVDNLKRMVIVQAKLLRSKDAEIEKLRAALEKISEYEIEAGCPCSACQHSAIARAAIILPLPQEGE